MLNSLRFGLSVLSLSLIAVSSAFAGEQRDVVELLHAWEQATEGIEATPLVGAFAKYAGSHNAHEVEVAISLSGAVDARTLINEFTWTSSDGEAGVILHGVPRDELTRLFCKGIDVQLDPRSATPRSIRFYDDATTPCPRAIVLPEPETRVQRVTARPVVPVSLIQLASGVSEVEEEPAFNLLEILERWAAATREIRRAELHFVRYRYDSIFFLEKRCRGRFRFESPRKGCYVLEPDDEASTEASRKKGPHGEPYTLSTESAEILYWDDEQLITLQPEGRSYQTFPVPDDLDSEIRTVGSWDRIWVSLADPQRLLPGVVDVHSSDFLDDFAWSVLSESDGRLTLRGVPRTLEERYEFAELQVILDARSYRTLATRRIAVGGTSEIVHVFHDSRYNEDAGAVDAWLPDLTRYTPINAIPLAPPAADEATSTEAQR